MNGISLPMCAEALQSQGEQDTICIPQRPAAGRANPSATSQPVEKKQGTLFSSSNSPIRFGQK